MYPHRIRLRGPWNCQPLARRGNETDDPLPPACTLTMPCRWSETRLAEFTGRVHFRRAFGYPGRIDTYERVWLLLEGIAESAEVSLNETRLTAGYCAEDTLEFEVTSLLRSRNELLVELDCTAGQGELWREAALEVRCTAFLRELRRIAILIEDRMELRVAGLVVGEAERPLEIYVLVESAVVNYQLVTATAEGTPFSAVLTDLSVQNQSGREGIQPLTVQVDLVNVASVWHSSIEQVMPQFITQQGE